MRARWWDIIECSYLLSIFVRAFTAVAVSAWLRYTPFKFVEPRCVPHSFLMPRLLLLFSRSLPYIDYTRGDYTPVLVRWSLRPKLDTSYSLTASIPGLTLQKALRSLSRNRSALGRGIMGQAPQGDRE